MLCVVCWGVLSRESKMGSSKARIPTLAYHHAMNGGILLAKSEKIMVIPFCFLKSWDA